MSNRPPYPYLRHQGFTLLETVLVITIMGILLGLATLSMGALDQRHFRNEINRLKLSLNQAIDTSLMKQETLAWFYDPETLRYEFRRWNTEKTWDRLDSPELFEGYQLPGDYTLEIDNEEIALGNTTKEKPSLVFLASGEYTPFKISIKADDRQPASLSGDGFGPVVEAQ